jgi:NCAIR mutase (PurE)-related protein
MLDESAKVKYVRTHDSAMTVRDVLERYKRGEIDAQQAERKLRLDLLKRIGDHTLFDISRSERRGIPEIVFGESKSPEEVAEIAKEIISEKEVLIISRASEEQYESIKRAIEGDHVRWEGKASMVVVDKRDEFKANGKIGILAAGTSDSSVAEEARIVAEIMGCHVLAAYDVGIAAFHRFLDPLAEMLEDDVDAIIVVAGMEGALASVVSSLTDVPVIGVPTSVGYGMGSDGVAALLSMLQSCSPGLAVVNIDNGVGAGATAALISKKRRNSYPGESNV